MKKNIQPIVIINLCSKLTSKQVSIAPDNFIIDEEEANEEDPTHKKRFLEKRKTFEHNEYPVKPLPIEDDDTNCDKIDDINDEEEDN